MLHANFDITFLWIPSHCEIRGNEIVDKAAKEGANDGLNTITLNTKLDLHEYKAEINKIIHDEIKTLHITSDNNYSTMCVNFTSKLNPRHIWVHVTNPKSRQRSILISKLRLNALKTKYIKNISCSCGHPLTVKHLVLSCKDVNIEFVSNANNFQTLEIILNDLLTLQKIASKLLQSNIKNLL